MKPNYKVGDILLMNFCGAKHLTRIENIHYEKKGIMYDIRRINYSNQIYVSEYELNYFYKDLNSLYAKLKFRAKENENI